MGDAMKCGGGHFDDATIHGIGKGDVVYAMCDGEGDWFSTHREEWRVGSGRLYTLRVEKVEVMALHEVLPPAGGEWTESHELYPASLDADAAALGRQFKETLDDMTATRQKAMSGCGSCTCGGE